MKGIIFTEFLELVEDKFGLDVLDEILDMSEDDGVYTAVGSYDHRDLVKLIVNLSKKTGIDAGTLQQVFGKVAFQALLRSIPMQSGIQSAQNTLQFIRLVEEYIHVEVKKLYPEAMPPTFDFVNEQDAEIIFDYNSARCMSHVCLGLIEGCADHFDDDIEIKMQPQVEDNSVVRFHLKLR